jgi:signal transduction histidine kinase/ligand-binding sensor protein
MFQKDKWPFTPVRLSEIIDKETLAVIEAGCCERLGRAMTIIDANQQTEEVYRIDSINLRQHYEGFCALLRNEAHVQGGNDACEEYDTKVAAKTCIKTTHCLPFQTFRCHMGLLDATHLVQVCDQTVAIVFAGQYRPPEGIGQIQENIRRLGSERYSHIQLLAETTRSELLKLAEQLPEAPADLGERLKREAEHIQRIAAAEYERLKNLWEHEFLDTLRTFNNTAEIATLEQLRQYTGKLLKLIQNFCRCEYVVFLGSVQEADTVLAPIAEIGLPTEVKKKLPHFNWKKAGLASETTSPNGWGGATDYRAALKGIRGDNSQFFAQASCVLPATLGHHYRGVLILGPFAEPVDFPAERRFLMEITDTVGGHVLTELEVLYLRQERRRWESTAKLLIHQLRTSLTPITTQVASARLLIQRNGSDLSLKEITDSLKRAEDLCLRLGRSARETVEAHVLLLEPEDLEFEKFPLSVLVANCLDGFGLEAEKRHRQLVVDPGVELLPEAEVDVARLTIALNNLIENALKYSFPNTKIHVRSMVEAPGDLELAAAVIEVDDLGDAVRPEDQERIFEQGARGLTRAKMGRIPGSGLGLWETRAVVAAHRGVISVVSEPTAIYRPQGQAHHVVFSVKIPLRQPQGK